MIPLFNIILFWIFFGCLCSYLARRRGRHPFLWFFIGLLLGIFGVVLVLVLPRPQPKSRKNVTIKAPVIEANPEEEWYYLDASHTQFGPISKEELLKAVDDGKLNLDSFVWKAGMKEWQTLSTLPELCDKLSLMTH